jgi:hypothetical protein
MSSTDVIEDAERRTRRKFYDDLVSRLTVMPDPADEAALETHEYHVGDIAWAAHLMARACGRDAILDVLKQLTHQMSESSYWDSLEQQKRAIMESAEELKDKYPEVWEHYREVASK